MMDDDQSWQRNRASLAVLCGSLTQRRWTFPQKPLQYGRNGGVGGRDYHIQVQVPPQPQVYRIMNETDATGAKNRTRAGCRTK
jgi:hypothetical protein